MDIVEQRVNIEEGKSPNIFLNQESRNYFPRSEPSELQSLIT